MRHSKGISRRVFLTQAGSAMAGLMLYDVISPLSRLFATQGNRIAVVQGRTIAKETVARMAAEAFNAMGGIGSFIRSGMNVVIKPNIGWNAGPSRAHNTNPDLVEAVAGLCVQRGARVKVFDRPCAPERMAYRNSGIQAAARNAGATVEFMGERYRTVRVPNGLNLQTLPVYEDILEADFVINMPIAKHHSLARLTMAMKNLMGVIGGDRGIYHGQMDKNIVDFVKAIPTHLTILDATRILINHGPASGTPADVRTPKTLVIGTNPVTVDAYGATLFGLRPGQLRYLVLASQAGMGEINLGRMSILRRTV
ncbi:MAG: DUF362 domain-containing protein [Spirochaetes bacterium]|nr:DUF362 domain-containing protein [Spirochaetota bacterium]